ncbi:tetratricopeptide repeat-containing glycosyltransferase family 2 protein [Clostridium botulinum]|uniref:tetratricopeptide repeat-containing glycosyltransferase family 2 protein n=1 Tax=Clostridium botulinum TaxID=1491 RepID=UPI003DA45717
MEITLCMIVKNEEENIEKCITSAFHIVDNAVIVDTGSMDSTKDIIKKFGEKVKLIEHEWKDDFSEARNISIENAKGDWILVLDADEEILGYKEPILKQITNTKKESFNIKGINKIDEEGGLNSFFYNRLFKNKGYKYYRAIHEQLNIDENKVGVLDEKISKIIHYGYSKENFIKRDKMNRNLRILANEYNKNSEDPFICYHLGATYASSGDYKNALNYFVKSYQIGLAKGFGGYYYELLKRMSQCIYLLKDYRLCIDFLTGILKDEKLKGFTDLYYILGSCLYEIKDYENAEKMFNECIKFGEKTKFPTFTGRGTFLAELMLARIYLALSNRQEAQKCYLKLLNYKEKLSEDIIEEINCYTKNVKTGGL